MKNFISIMCLLCFSMSAGFSQTNLKMGVRAGVNIATYSFDFGTTPAGFVNPIGNTTGFTLGVPVEFGISDLFAVQAELNFIQKGFSLSSESSGTGFLYKFTGTSTVNWLEIPILAKIKLGSPEGISGGFFAGPSIGFGLSGQGKSTSTSTINGVTKTESSTNTLNFKDDNHSQIDFALNLGGEVNYMGAFLDIRYQLGLTNMSTDKSTSTTGSAQSAKTRGLGISVGYRFAIGGK
jgi:Outer membrane protein beta-barrel domain